MDTAGIVHLETLEFVSPRKAEAERYEAISADRFTAAIQMIDLGSQRLTFVDIGAGKGRALLLASDMQFHRVIGVELSPQLAETARVNAVRWRNRRPGSVPIEVICADAVNYEFPDEPLLVYMYNPFGPPLRRMVLGNLAESLRRMPRECYVVLLGDLVPDGESELFGFTRGTEPYIYQARHQQG